MKSERGFALPFTIFLATLITVMLAATFTRAASEHLVSESSDASISALTIAQSGLQAFFADTFSVRPMEGDSFRYNMVGGYAWVYPVVIQRPADPLEDIIYIVRSVGQAIYPNLGATPQATRVVAQFGKWQIGNMRPPGLLTIPNGLTRRAGGSGPNTVSGFDQCSEEPPVRAFRAPVKDSIAGLVVDTISGNIVPSNLQGGSPLTVANESGVDWDKVVSGGFTPDYTSLQMGNSTYPSQLIVGDLTISGGSGYGLLIVTGDLTFNGASVTWRGVILVGGRILFNGSSTVILGAVFSGLNKILGLTPPPSEMGGPGFGTVIRYQSCEIRNALESLTGFVPINKALVDNWATY